MDIKRYLRIKSAAQYQGRSAEQIRNDNAYANGAEYRSMFGINQNPNVTWNSNNTAYEGTNGMSEQDRNNWRDYEYNRINSIYDNMSQEEQKQFQDKYDEHMRALGYGNNKQVGTLGSPITGSTGTATPAAPAGPAPAPTTPAAPTPAGPVAGPPQNTPTMGASSPASAASTIDLDKVSRDTGTDDGGTSYYGDTSGIGNMPPIEETDTDPATGASTTPQPDTAGTAPQPEMGSAGATPAPTSSTPAPTSGGTPRQPNNIEKNQQLAKGNVGVGDPRYDKFIEKTQGSLQKTQQKLTEMYKQLDELRKQRDATADPTAKQQIVAQIQQLLLKDIKDQKTLYGNRRNKLISAMKYGIQIDRNGDTSTSGIIEGEDMDAYTDDKDFYNGGNYLDKPF